MQYLCDFERDEFITLDELKEEFQELKNSGNTEADTFEDYLSNCMDYNNGTLEEV